MKLSKLSRLGSIFRTHDGDAIPFTLVLTSVILSVVSIALGALFALGDFLVNIAASLAVLGPGLAITNLAVRSWRHSKNRDQVKPSFAALVRGFYLLLESVEYLLENTRNGAGSASRAANEAHSAGALLLQLKEAEAALEKRKELVKAGQKPGVAATMIPVTRKLLELPDLRLALALVTGINAIQPVPAAVTAATFLSHKYSSAPFVTVYHVSPPSGSISREKLGIQSACLGFHRFRITAVEHDAHVDNADSSPMTVIEVLYVDCLRELTHLAAKTLQSLISELPPVQHSYWASLAPATSTDII